LNAISQPRRRHSRLGNHLSPADYEHTITTGIEVSG
jgi:hypothetical protein